jgi:hypothetical protein
MGSKRYVSNPIKGADMRALDGTRHYDRIANLRYGERLKGHCA